jgi:hypothetical protein
MQDDNHDQELDQSRNNESPAPGESYVRYAVLSLVLYFALWVPGFLVNTVYLARALGEERETGRAPEGKGCLIALIIAGMVVPILGVCVLVIMSLGEVS